MGPITLFDKSFLQSLKVDESVWFDHFFLPVVAPLFFVETLADLSKKPREGKTAEQEVGLIAIKTPQMSGAPCIFHNTLCQADLRGSSVPMTGQIPRAGIRMVRKGGKLGGVAEESKEAKAFHRWQKGQFQALERELAVHWRAAVESIDLGAIEQSMKSVGINAQKCKTVEEVHALARRWVLSMTKSSGRFYAALQFLQIPRPLNAQIKARWKYLGKPNFYNFAPYAAHVLTVELFFAIALGANLIGSGRPSHRVDIAYLYYLPFCSVFTSGDNLHRLCAPLFLREDQSFIWGKDLKDDLQAIDEHFKALPEEIRATGIYKFAKHVPDIELKVIRDLYTKYTKLGVGPGEVTARNEEADAKMLAEIKKWEHAPAANPLDSHDEEMETLMIQRLVSPQRGSWIQLTKEQAGAE